MFRFLRRDKEEEEKPTVAESSESTGRSWRNVMGGIFSRNRIDPEFWDELEEALIVSDVGIHTSTRLVDDLRERASQQGAREPDAVRDLMRQEIVRILESAGSQEALSSDAPMAVMVVGVNGSGKTTTIAKLARAAKESARSPLIVAGDTFRAGAIEQLRIWAERTGSDFVSSSAGADPASVVYDGMTAARARGADFVIIDTAGRLHTASNLMEELKKVRRVFDRESEGYQAKVVLVIDGTTGQNGMLQAKMFSDGVRCDGVVLTKLDSTAKGGVAIAISEEMDLPIWFIGTGESKDDLVPFDAQQFAEALLPLE